MACLSEYFRDNGLMRGKIRSRMLYKIPAICPMRKSKTIVYNIPYKILLLYILQNLI